MKALFLPRAEKSLAKFTPAEQKFIIEKVLIFSKNSQPLRNPNVRKVKLFNFFRLRVGKFRVFFEIEDNSILIGQICRRDEKTYR